MPTSHLFAYNTGTTLSGTVQVGDLAISQDNLDYGNVYSALTWWNGPDEDLGYVIAHTTPDGTQPNQGMVPAYLGFWRSKELTENSFVSLASWVAQGSQYFINGDQAKLWLNGEGYWTNFTSGSTVVFYSGETYEQLWVSGMTVTATSTNYNFYSYEPTYLGVSFDVGGTALITDTWQTYGFYDFTGYQTLSCDISLAGFGGGLQVTLILTNGITYLSSVTTDLGSQTLNSDISTWSGIGQIQIEISGSGNGFWADLQIFSVYLQN